MPFLLAASFDAGLYISPVKVAVVVVLLLGWAACTQWIDRDTNVVKTRREQWNLIVISGGAVATFALFVIPFSGQLFAVGIAVWVLLSGAPVAAYIMHRNGRVMPDARVLTPGHLKRLLGVGGPRKRSVKPKAARVQIMDHAAKFVEPPEDYEDALAYNSLQDFFFDLIWHRATEAEMAKGKEAYRLVYRVDGLATETPDGIPFDEGERIIRFLKKIAGLNVEEIRRPQTGQIELALLSQEGAPEETEVTTSGTTAGEKLNLRFHTATRVYRLHEIGLAKPRMDSLRQVLGKHGGMVLISAPPGNGLTTTEYAIIRGHDAYMNNIFALERRPLSDVDNITQQVYEGANKDVNFARMLQSVLRKEPDIVLVGECEDRETAMVATRAAANGRKVYMGMQAKDSFDALSRYLAYLGDPAMAARVLLGVTGQRLIRILCTECREAFEPDPATLKKLNLPVEKIERFYRPPTVEEGKKGKKAVCQKCQGSGYYGRTGVYELLVVDDTAKKLIAEGASTGRIKVQCRKNRMYYLQEEALLKVIDGTTSMDEILRCLRAGDR